MAAIDRPAIDSYILGVVCALACELQLFPLISKGIKCSSSKEGGKSGNCVTLNGSSHEFQNGIVYAVCHTCRILGILEVMFSLKLSLTDTSWGYSSNEIIVAAMVATHVSELFRRSKACMHALSVLMRCKWDNEIHTISYSFYSLIDIHGKAVASIVNKAQPWKHICPMHPFGGSPRRAQMAGRRIWKAHFAVNQKYPHRWTVKIHLMQRV